MGDTRFELVTFTVSRCCSTTELVALATILLTECSRTPKVLASVDPVFPDWDSRTRTYDRAINSRQLYQLSYVPLGPSVRESNPLSNSLVGVSLPIDYRRVAAYGNQS